MEGAVNILYRRVYAPLRDRTFHRLDDLNAAIAPLLDTHNQTRLQGKTHSRRMLFDEREQAHLTALPTTTYLIKYYLGGRVQKNGHVLLSADKHYCSVPYRYIGQRVRLICTPDERRNLSSAPAGGRSRTLAGQAPLLDH